MGRSPTDGDGALFLPYPLQSRSRREGWHWALCLFCPRDYIPASPGGVMGWEKLLAWVAGEIDQELHGKIEYLVAENHILRDQIKGRLRFTDARRSSLATIGAKPGKPPWSRSLAS
jgi:hypothetical protein